MNKEEKLLIEGYKAFGKENLKIAKEWEFTENDGL